MENDAHHKRKPHMSKAAFPSSFQRQHTYCILCLLERNRVVSIFRQTMKDREYVRSAKHKRYSSRSRGTQNTMNFRT